MKEELRKLRVKYSDNPEILGLIWKVHNLEKQVRSFKIWENIFWILMIIFGMIGFIRSFR